MWKIKGVYPHFVERAQAYSFMGALLAALRMKWRGSQAVRIYRTE